MESCEEKKLLCSLEFSLLNVLKKPIRQSLSFKSISFFFFQFNNGSLWKRASVAHFYPCHRCPLTYTLWGIRIFARNKHLRAIIWNDGQVALRLPLHPAIICWYNSGFMTNRWKEFWCLIDWVEKCFGELILNTGKRKKNPVCLIRYVC